MKHAPHPAGANDIDEHFRTAPFESNLPVTMGLLGIWNVSFLHHSTRAILPYAQALAKLAPHIQQVRLQPALSVTKCAALSCILGASKPSVPH